MTLWARSALVLMMRPSGKVLLPDTAPTTATSSSFGEAVKLQESITGTFRQPSGSPGVGSALKRALVMSLWSATAGLPDRFECRHERAVSAGPDASRRGPFRFAPPSGGAIGAVETQKCHRSLTEPTPRQPRAPARAAAAKHRSR